MEQPNPTFAKIPILDTGKFKQWKFRIQQYLQNEHYTLWEVIEFGDSYKAPQEVAGTSSASEGSAKKKGRTVATFGGNEATKKTKKNQLKQQYGNYDGTMMELSLDDLYNHLKVYEPEVQKKSESNSQNMAFISSAKTSSGKEEVNTTSFSTASTQVSSAIADVATASFSHDTIDEDDIKEMDIKWNIALLSMRADRFWKKTKKKITIQGTNVAGFDKLKVECFNCYNMGHFARECRTPRSQDRGRRENFKQGSKEAPIEFALLAKSSSDTEDRVLFPPPPSPPAQVYSSPKKDKSWKRLPEFADDTITDYSRPSPSIKSNFSDLQNRDFFVSKKRDSSESIMSKPMIKFVKATDSPTEVKISKVVTARKPSVKVIPKMLLMTKDLEFLARVYKVEKAMYGLHQALRAWYGTLSKYLLTNGFQRGTIDQTLFIKNHRGNFILVQVYVDDIIFESSNPQLCREFEALMHEKFQMSAMANTPMDKENLLGKNGTGKDVDLHLYRSMIGSLMYLTASRPDIMFVVCACARHQVTLKECHLHAVKRIFRYLKGHLKLGIWYPKDSPFDLVAYSDSDYDGATQDRKSTTGGCQFLGRRLISWQCKKQTIMATSTTEAEYVTAASGYGQVLWIQN
nr:hypothetical protein [Tanacetum cinerariifolium]